MKPKDQRYTVACDFDGCLHRYDSPWVGPEVIPDPPVEGAIEWLKETLAGGFDVVIHTTRGKTPEGRTAVHRWLLKYWPDAPLAQLQVVAEKPPALVYLDDRAIRFEGPGSFPSVKAMLRARPWNKGGMSCDCGEPVVTTRRCRKCDADPEK